MTHLGADTIRKRLPSVLEIGHNFANVDITREPIPVVPTIHYQMGGVPTNVHGQVVAPKGGDPNAVVPGLYAVGECSCVSVHGANRLGTNSLLDLLVFGRAAGNHIVDSRLAGQAHRPLPAHAPTSRRRGWRGSTPAPAASTRRRSPTTCGRRCRCMPASFAPRRRWTRASARCRRSPSAPGRCTSPTSRRSSTPPASRRSRSTT